MTPREQNEVNIFKSFCPANFLSKETDDKILAYLNLTLADITYTQIFIVFFLLAEKINVLILRVIHLLFYKNNNKMICKN